MRVFKLNFAYELDKFGKRNIVLIILFMWWLKLIRNLLICRLNAVNFNFRLPKFILSFFCQPLHGYFLKFDWVKPPCWSKFDNFFRVVNLWCKRYENFSLTTHLLQISSSSNKPRIDRTTRAIEQNIHGSPTAKTFNFTAQTSPLHNLPPYQLF